MPQVTINTPAPNFTLTDYKGELFSLSDLHGKFDVLLVFNRTFT